MRPISFAIEKRGAALSRAGLLKTPHGTVATPAFVAVATKANVKGVAAEHYSALGLQILIANTYHLDLSGLEAVEAAGGVGAFMGWEGPTMTDSGGFQVFSLGAGFGKKLSKFLPEGDAPEEALARFDEERATTQGMLAVVDEDGVSFRSHLDGSLHRFTPERSIELQHRLGADIIFAFDECTAPDAPYAYQREAMDRTHRWAKRSVSAHRQALAKNDTQGIYGIVQGGRYPDLRVESAHAIAALDFDGFGIGGSFSKRDILGILGEVNTALPEGKPRHLLGIGEPEDLFIGAFSGIDTFDCVLPTRNGRTGGLYTKRGKIQIPNAEFREDFGQLDEGCACPVCAHHTRAYLHHLFRSRELLGPVLASMHNLYFLASLAGRIREEILKGDLERFRDSFFSHYKVR